MYLQRYERPVARRAPDVESVNVHDGFVIFERDLHWTAQSAMLALLGQAGGAVVIVPRADRPQLVARLRSEGLSQQQIGDTLGVNQATVNRDLNMQMHNEDEPPTITNARGQERPTTYAPRSPANVDANTGGRSKRRPLPDQAKTVASGALSSFRLVGSPPIPAVFNCLTRYS